MILRTQTFSFQVRLAAVFLLLLLFLPESCQAQEVWFFPTDHLPRRGHVYSPDYMQLFQPNAPWRKAASRIDVFQMTPIFPIRASDDELRQLFAFLRAHKIALALNMGLIANERGECGHGEGYINPQEADLVIRRVKSLGGEPKYLIGDEPLYFGHTCKNPDTCHYSIDELAQRVAVIVNKVTTAFPAIRICMGEVVPGNPVWEMEAWIGAFHRATGRRIDAFHVDMDWRNKDWPVLNARLRDMLTRAHIKFGVIYDSKGPQPTDLEAMRSVQENIRTFEATSPKPPEQILFENWTFHPSHVLPETDPTSHTAIINWYFDRPDHPKWLDFPQRRTGQ